MNAQVYLPSMLFATILATSTAVTAQSAAPSTAISTATPTTAAPAAKKWICTAEGLAEFRYDGSSWAFIRLSAYSSGHQYRVTKDETGDVAKGNTQDRTPFICTNK
jgi:hypothetical protein